MVDFWIPQTSSGEIVGIAQLEAAIVQRADAHWKLLKGARRFPSRPDAVLEQVSSNAILVRVLEDDYEYLSVGDALVAGFRENFSGRRLSDIIATTPRFGLGLKMLYEMVRSGCEPLYYRGWVGADMPDAQFIYYESAVLPFGRDEARVDHIMVTSMLVLRDQAYPAMPQSLRM
ncbi:MAG: hypothetical protein ABI608_00765 [Rhizomicrobium sp.]